MSKEILDLNILDREHNTSQPLLPFRRMISRFLDAYGEPTDGEGMPSWRTTLQLPYSSAQVSLFIIQEDIDDEMQDPFCRHCRISGWSNNFVSKRRFHIVIPADSDWKGPFDLAFLNRKEHILHGLIHCNGFGHLLCINGRERGSRHLNGKEVMDFWDRLCSILYTRAISVEDVSEKRSMKLRLLYATAFGHPWFGKWKYHLLRGVYGVTEREYNAAANRLKEMKIEEILEGITDIEVQRDVKKTFFIYNRWSQTPLETLGGLFSFMLSINSPITVLKKGAANDASPREEAKSIESLTESIQDRWEKFKQRVPEAAHTIVDILIRYKAEGKGRVRGTDLLNEAKVGFDHGFMSHVLSKIDNVKVKNHVIKREMVDNKGRFSYEYFIDHVGEGSNGDEVGADLVGQIQFLFNHLVAKSTSPKVKEAVEIVLQCKHFVKRWPMINNENQWQQLMFMCQIEEDEEEDEKVESYEGADARCLEIILLPLQATTEDLRVAAENLMRDTYCLRDDFEVTGIVDVNNVWDVSRLRFKSGGDFIVRARGLDHTTEGGPKPWKVACICGAKDDDGERMVKCSKCHVKQHIRCHKLKGFKPAFVCDKCQPGTTGGRLFIN